MVRHGTTDAPVEVPQWDLHLLGAWEHRDLFGGLRRFRLEERPRLIFAEAFPRTVEPHFGNLLTTAFSQPAFLEARTTLRLDAAWDFGPDPFLDISRHQVDLAASAHRLFGRRRVYLEVGFRETLYRVAGRAESALAGVESPANSDLFVAEQEVRVDLRNHPVRTRSGMHLSLSLQEAGYWLPSSWDYVRVEPDLRLYAPLFWQMVLVTRFSLGALFLHEAAADLDSTSQTLGPASERLRGGGGTGNRGFFPGELGDGPEGGIRSWLASAELRVPVTRNLSLTTFFDMGDVSREPRFRFDHPQATAGLGMRLVTILGPVTLNFGYRLPDLQVTGEDRRDPGGRLTEIDLLLFTFPGAVNLTLGDTF